jgi:hypothetical protein
MVSVPITLEQLIAAVLQLQADERALVAQALLQADLRSDLGELTEALSAQPAIENTTDDDLLANVQSIQPTQDSPAKHSILALKGLGKSVWQDIEVKTYLDQERESWNG